MMPRPTTRSSRLICDGLRSRATPQDSCLPDFAGWSGYPLIAALSINPRIDVMGHVWTAPGWQGESSLCGVGRSCHVFGLLARFTRPLAIMPSADQVPIKSTHSKMPWPMWVVLIAGSTGTALSAVRPPNRYVTPDVRCNLDSFTPRERRVPGSIRSWLSSPRPSSRVCWRARWRRPWWVAAPTIQ
jgi:hypothetical protein